MIKKILIMIIVLLIMPIVMATNYVDDPENCPDVYNSVYCSGSLLQCGINTGPPEQPWCYDMSTLSSGTDITETNNPTGSFNGGMVVDCDATNGAEPYCDTSIECDYNSVCYGTTYRQTNCTGWGAYSCSFVCRTGFQYCTDLDTPGTSNTEICDIDTNTDPCSELGAYSGVHNQVQSSCACACDSGWQVCTGLGAVGDSEDGCSIGLTNNGCSDIPGGSYSDLNTDAQSDCACDCVSGWGYCSGESTPIDYTDRQVEGCQIEVNDLGSCSALNGAYVDSHNDVNTNCDCTCDTGYTACTTNNSVAGDGTGCDYQDGVSDDSGWGWSGVNTVVDSSCVSDCVSGFLNCDDDFSGTGCEIQDGGSCSSGGLAGTYNGCVCEVDSVSYGTSGVKQNWSGTLPFLWFQQYSLTGWIFNATNFYNKTIGFTNNSCLYLNGSEYCGDADFPSGCFGCGNSTAEIIIAANTTGFLQNWALFDNNTWNDTEQMQDATGAMAGAHLTYTDATNDLSVDDDWYNSVSDIPTATPSSGDTTHLSTADHIYDWVIGLSYITNTVGDLVNYYTKTLTTNFFVNRTDWTTIDDYPNACSTGQYVSGVGDTLTCGTPPDSTGGWVNTSTTVSTSLNVTISNDLNVTGQIIIGDFEMVQIGGRLIVRGVS